MTLRVFTRLSCLLSSLFVCSLALADQPASGSPLQSTLSQSAQSGQFTFIVFYRDSGEATSAFYQQTQRGLAAHGDKVVLTTARVDDPAESGLVEKLGIARAPMPMAVVIAPNSAVTGLFPRRITPENISASIVPPTMMRCMKELQDQKLVFVCLTRSEQAEVPQGVQAVQEFPHFQGKISVVGMRLDDPNESRFLQQMKVDPQRINGPYSVLIAPPGALIGHFDASSTAEQIAAAIHKAGQCCEDENCKHNHGPQAQQPQANPR